MQWVMKMPDYKEMYLKMVRASERTINILIEAQRECEGMYLSEPELTVFPDKEEAPERRDTQAQGVDPTHAQ